MDRARTGRTLFHLIGRHEHSRSLDIRTDREWHEVLALAREYRLLPLLHGKLARGEIELSPPMPPFVREELRTAHRESALLNLAYRTEQFALAELFDRHGIRSAFLKGSWLAWYAYPAAAERPLRDIDVLVGEEEVLRAFELLRNQGYVQAEPSARAPDEMVGRDKHLPPLVSPSGIEVELHMHAWEPAAAMEWSMPSPVDRRILSDAVTGEAGDPCRYPDPQHMLAHLCIHAAYSHRFDVGPQVLVDIDALVHCRKIDWPCFWRNAEAGGWSRGAAMVLRLCERWMRDDIHLLGGCCETVPLEAIDAAESLMTQDQSRRKEVALAASLISAGEAGGWSGSLKRIGARLRGPNRPEVPADGAVAESFPGWLLRRSREVFAQVGNGDLLRTAKHHVEVGRWLDGGEA